MQVSIQIYWVYSVSQELTLRKRLLLDPVHVYHSALELNIFAKL